MHREGSDLAIGPPAPHDARPERLLCALAQLVAALPSALAVRQGTPCVW